MILSSLVATYLDLWLVGKGFFTFPHRPFPEIFTVHIGFTLLIVPIMTVVFIYLFQRGNVVSKSALLMFVALGAALFENVSAYLGLLTLSAEWQSLYSSFGYPLFLLVMSMFHRWMQ
ncbi:CBO0543 family protein [Desertibacillus haloalkaliphilus]|uniref:CBO0543 family protein n=1 Tax=Desertibacillus haloalkaliphilus TaxID=1328930 RepID=UPI0034D9656D